MLNKFSLIINKNKGNENNCYSTKYWFIKYNGVIVGEMERRKDWVKRKQTDRIRTKMAYIYNIIWDKTNVIFQFPFLGINDIHNSYSVEGAIEYI